MAISDMEQELVYLFAQQGLQALEAGSLAVARISFESIARVTETNGEEKEQ